MKIVILLAAGLSAPSNLPNYSHFKPHRAHYECIKIEKYCKVFDIDFYHYTLNIDNLNEIVWQANDILIVLGLSGNEHPLALLESIVTAKGAAFYNYDFDTLQSTQYTNKLLGRFSAAKIISLIPVEFEIYDLGSFEVELRTFTVNDREYEIYFSPSLAYYTCPDEITFIEQHIGHQLTDKAYEVKFDLRANREQNKSFVRPLDNFTLGSLNLLGLILMTTIEAHCTLKNAQLYTASAAYKSLTSFYSRFAKCYAGELNYNYWCAFGPDGHSDGENYAFKKRSNNCPT